MTIRAVGIILASHVVLGGIGNVLLTAVALNFRDRVRQHSAVTHAIAVVAVIVMVQGPMLILEKQKGVKSTLCELSNFAIFAIVEYGVVKDEVGIIFELLEGFVLKAHYLFADLG